MVLLGNLNIMTLLNYSLHRSATTSTSQVYRDMNVKVLDWVGWDFEDRHNELFSVGKTKQLSEMILKEFPDHQFYGDNPVPVLFEMMDMCDDPHPFIVLRDVDAWAISSLRHCEGTAALIENPRKPYLTPGCDLFVRYHNENYSDYMNKEHDAKIKLWRYIYLRHIEKFVHECFVRHIEPKFFVLSDNNLASKLQAYGSYLKGAKIINNYKFKHHHRTEQ